MGREVDLVDDQQVRSGDSRAALARDLVAAGDVDHVEREVGELGRKGRGEVVAAALDEDDVQVGKARRHACDRLEVDRCVLADRRVRAAAGLDADDALGRRAPRRDEELLVLLGVDVVGDDGEVVAVAHRLAQHSTSVVLPEPTGPPTPTRSGCLEVLVIVALVSSGADARYVQDRNSREYCVSCGRRPAPGPARWKRDRRPRVAAPCAPRRRSAHARPAAVR